MPTNYGLGLHFGRGYNKPLPEGWTLKESDDDWAVATAPDGTEHLLGEEKAYPITTRNERLICVEDEGGLVIVPTLSQPAKPNTMKLTDLGTVKAMPIFRIIDGAEDYFLEEPAYFEHLTGKLHLSTGEDDGMWNPDQTEIHFYCGPEDYDGSPEGTCLNEGLSCYDWMGTLGLDALLAKYGATIYIGDAENLHTINKEPGKAGFTAQELADLWKDLCAIIRIPNA